MGGQTQERNSVDPGDPSQIALIVDDATADTGIPVPEGFQEIGRVVDWNRSPSFTDVAGLLEPGSEVKPGQFLAVWHGRRRINTLTIIQVSTAFEVNPNEVPDLAAAREALGLGRGYAGEGVSTRIFRLAECATVEEFDLRKTVPGA